MTISKMSPYVSDFGNKCGVTRQTKNDNVDPLSERKTSQRRAKTNEPIAKTTQEDLDGEIPNKKKVLIVRHSSTMKHSQNLKMILLFSNATPIKFQKPHYKCCICEKKFDVPGDVKKHCLKHDEDSRKEFVLKNQTVYDAAINLDITALKCNICSEKIDDLQSLIEHLRTKHEKRLHVDIKNKIIPVKFVDKKAFCGICNTIIRIRQVNEHLSVHYRNYICDICDAGFVTKRNIKIHMYKRHRNVEKIKESEEELSELNKHRINARTLLKYSNATPIRQRGGIGYTCCFCKNQYPDPADLKRHTIEDHDDDDKISFMENHLMYAFIVKLDITGLKCNLCEKPEDNIEQIIEHLISEHGIKFFTDLKSHMVPFKFETNELKCTMCSKTFGRFKLLHEHTTGHFRNYICDVCGAGFVNRRTLAVHYDTHKYGGDYKCQFCGKLYDTNQKKKKHEYAVHIHRQMISKCGYCNERFKDGRARDKHLVKVHNVQFQTIKCEICDKVFNNKSTLRTHVRRDHLLERNYECSQCDMKFYKRQQLNHHMLTHTGQKRYPCELCTDSFGKKSTLQEHMRVHADPQAEIQ